MKRFLVAAVVACLSTMSLSACSFSALVSGSQVNVAQIGTLDSVNTDVTTLQGMRNANELANLTTASFYNVNAKGDLVANEKLGEVKVLSKKPLTVSYTINKGVTWSDGVQIDAADLALSFAAAKSLGATDFGSIRQSAGASFASLKSVPKAGDLTLTLEFSKPVTDYLNALKLSVPAHIVAKYADESNVDQAKGKNYVLSAVTGADEISLKKLSRVYRQSFVTSDLAGHSLEASQFASSGAYRVEKIDAKSNITLVANPSFAAGETTKVERVKLMYFTDATAAVAAMVAGDIDISAAEDSGLASLGDLETLSETATDPKINTVLAGGSQAEQILFNFGSGSSFARGTAGRNLKEAQTLRQAFLHLVPKQRILEMTAARYTTSTSDSFIFDSGSDYYESSVRDNGSSEYLIQDVEKAGEMLDSLGLRKPIQVRVVFDTDNPRAQSEWFVLQDRAHSAGFDLVNVASSDPTATLLAGEFDVYLGAFPLMSAPDADVFALSGGSAVAFESDEVNALLVRLATAKEGIAQKQILKDIDAELFKAAYGMPLYEVPSMLLYSSRVGGFVASPHCFSATWGYFNWLVSATSATSK